MKNVKQWSCYLYRKFDQVLLGAVVRATKNVTRILIRVPKLNEKIFKLEAYLLIFQTVITVLGVFSTSFKVNVSAISALF